jgi:threonylcarbamoyladenosine tRNA methylthiotransferase MtaB
MPSVALYTLGCKLNQLESESIADAFVKAGFALAPWGEGEEEPAPGNPADILVINTCTVTSHSEQKARRIIRKALRDNPLAALIVTGCYAQLEAEALEALGRENGQDGRLFVIPGDNKSAILDLPDFLASSFGGGEGASYRSLIEDWLGKSSPESASFRFSPTDFSFHSRAFLKIQDGCDNSCAYCRVSIARGKNRSLRVREALASLKALENRGFGEAVLTGVNISQYRDGAMGLGGLLEYLLEGTKTIAIRLSSIEPEVFPPDFMKAVSHERVRPHFHLSLQSGSDAVLSRMGRHYTSAEAKEGIRQLKEARDDPFMACDIITGFPGEAPGEFEKTFEFCREADFAWIHAFPFSRRPGTAAWHFKGRVSEREAGERAARLEALARKGKAAYAQRWIGKELEVIAEADQGKTPGFVPGVTANYLKALIRLNGEKIEGGASLRCRILEAAGAGTRFDVVGVKAIYYRQGKLI